MCDPETEAVPSEVRLVDLTEVAVALLTEVAAVMRAGRRAWFVSRSWRRVLGGKRAAGIINLGSDDRRVLYGTLASEKAARVLSGDVNVAIPCRFAYRLGSP